MTAVMNNPPDETQYRFSKAADEALGRLYAEYGSDQTLEQKLRILETELCCPKGTYVVFADGIETTVAFFEHDWLAVRGIIELDLG